MSVLVPKRFSSLVTKTVPQPRSIADNDAGLHVNRKQILFNVLLLNRFFAINREKTLAAEWDYDSEWEFGSCKTGNRQSPINVERMAVRDLDQHLKVSYSGNINNVTCINNAHGSPRLNFSDNSCCLIWGGKVFVLQQLHFHVPSEHSIDSHKADIEAHLVHECKETGELLVVAVLMKATKQHCKQSPLLEISLESCPAEFGIEIPLKHPISIDEFLTANQRFSFYSYQGSLTTPPCTEKVTWLIRSDEVQCSYDQIIRLQRVAGGHKTLKYNSRPLQNISGRDITRVQA